LAQVLHLASKLPTSKPLPSLHKATMGFGCEVKVFAGRTVRSGRFVESQQRQEQPQSRVVLGRYSMVTEKAGIVGEGHFSRCHKGIDLVTGAEVAIKVYKRVSMADATATAVALRKFRRQVTVLEELQRPLKRPRDQSLWSEELAAAEPSDLFLRMLDYSRDADGQPGPDPGDGIMYIVTEIGQYSLKQFLAERRQERRPLSEAKVWRLARKVVLIVAGLHAKGLVHLDLKPDNLMMFDGCLKLIDVDGCVPVGSALDLNDTSISYSPCYCAPEWAHFVACGEKGSIAAETSLDVWSVGMTVAELVSLSAVMKPRYMQFARAEPRRGGVCRSFMEWLGHLEIAPLPEVVRNFDTELRVLLEGSLLCEGSRRASLAQCLSQPYLTTVSAGAAIKRG